MKTIPQPQLPLAEGEQRWSLKSSRKRWIHLISLNGALQPVPAADLKQYLHDRAPWHEWWCSVNTKLGRPTFVAPDLHNALQSHVDFKDARAVAALFWSKDAKALVKLFDELIAKFDVPVPDETPPPEPVHVVVETPPDFSVLALTVEGCSSLADLRPRARALHTFMGSDQQFARWFENRVANLKLVEGQDFGECLAPMLGIQQRSDTVDYWLSMRVAKHIAMMERNDRGTLARDYFIQCEEQLLLTMQQRVTQVPDFTDPYQMAVMLRESSQRFLDERGARDKAELALSHTQATLASTERNQLLLIDHALKVSDAAAAETQKVQNLLAKVEAAQRGCPLTQFFKDMEAFLGLSTDEGFAYMVDTGVLCKKTVNDWGDESYYPTQKFAGLGMFQSKRQTYNRPLKDEAGNKTDRFVVVQTRTLYLTPPKKDAEGQTVHVGGYDWLKDRMTRDARVALGRVMAASGGRTGRFAKLAGCKIVMTKDTELAGLASLGDRVVSMAIDSSQASKRYFVGKHYKGVDYRAEAGSAEAALENLLQQLP